MQVIRPARVYPVIVIGSGAAGCIAAWNLTRQGVEVCLLAAQFALPVRIASDLGARPFVLDLGKALLERIEPVFEAHWVS